MINDIDAVWAELESKKAADKKDYFKMVCSELLYRVYVGSTGIPSRRYIIFEIPESEKGQFDAFVEPKGFSLILDDAIVKHSGFLSCVMQASSCEDNDVFSVVVSDIIEEISVINDPETYVKSLRSRIEKWREFFRSGEQKRLSDESVVGLIGELTFIHQSLDAGIEYVPDIWNGPIKAAQDFQGKRTAVEIKTVSANALKSVHISSEIQLDDSNFDHLFLTVYRVERNDEKGLMLPDYIEQTADMMTGSRKNRFYAKLICAGYDPQKARDQYIKGYIVRERENYSIENGFPRIIRNILPKGVDEVKYRLDLQACNQYKVDFDKIIETLKEN